MKRGFWFDFACDVAIGFFVAIGALIATRALGFDAWWPVVLAGGLYVAISTWNPGGDR